MGFTQLFSGKLWSTRDSMTLVVYRVYAIFPSAPTRNRQWLIEKWNKLVSCLPVQYIEKHVEAEGTTEVKEVLVYGFTSLVTVQLQIEVPATVNPSGK